MTIEIQRRVDLPGIPPDEHLARYARAALDAHVEVNLRIVDEAEGRALNLRWRGKDYATNVLSFPASLPPEVRPPTLGDVVLCAPVIAREAETRGLPLDHHYAHLVIHGILHLQGHDHTESEAAVAMEALERRLLGTLGIPDPYMPRMGEDADAGRF